MLCFDLKAQRDLQDNAAPVVAYFDRQSVMIAVGKAVPDHFNEGADRLFFNLVKRDALRSLIVRKDLAVVVDIEIVESHLPKLGWGALGSVMIEFGFRQQAVCIPLPIRHSRRRLDRSGLAGRELSLHPAETAEALALRALAVRP